MNGTGKDVLWNCYIQAPNGQYLEATAGGTNSSVLITATALKPAPSCEFIWYTDGTILSVIRNAYLYNDGAKPYLLTAGNGLPPLAYVYEVGSDGSIIDGKSYKGNIRLKNPGSDSTDDYWTWLDAFHNEIGLGPVQTGSRNNGTLFTIILR